MKALVCKHPGEPESLSFEDWPAPTPRDGEVLVALHAAGLNYPDILQVAGTYQIGSSLPCVFGAEGAGEVLACGAGVEQFRPGDRVLVLAMGCWAEQVCVPAAALVRLAEGIDMVSAAAFPVAYNTAWHALLHRGNLRAGETLLVHGASGGVGLAAVQIGKYLGARVIATGSCDDKLERIRRLGADQVINCRTQALREVLYELTGGAGVDVVFDPVGGAQMDATLKSLAPFGRLLVIGFTSGQIAQLPSNLLLLREAVAIGVNIGQWTRRNPAASRQNLVDIQTRIAAGELAPYVARTFDLVDGAAALRSILNREVVGKYVLLTELGKLHANRCLREKTLMHRDRAT